MVRVVGAETVDSDAIALAEALERRRREAAARWELGSELVLVDAGAEHLGYASDVTRTYPLSGRFTAEQAELHELVRATGMATIRRCTAGTEFRDVHRTAALVLAEGLGRLACSAARPRTWWSAAPWRSSCRTAWGTWWGSASATPARPCPVARPTRASRGCASTCRSSPATW